MIVLDPVAISDAELSYSSIPALSDHAAWSAGTTYGLGDRAVRGRRIVESLIAGNVGNTPEANADKWLDVGPTNRWAMFDPAAGPRSTDTAQIRMYIDPVVPVTAIGLVDVEAASIRIVVEASSSATLFDQTVAGGGTRIWTGLPNPAGMRIIVEINPVNGAAAVSKLLIGAVHDFGVTETGVTLGITDYSRRETDEFGVTTIVPRAWAKRLGTRTRLSSSAVDEVKAKAVALRARPALWVADPDNQALAVYGFGKDFGVDFDYGETSFSRLTIDGLPSLPAMDSGADPAVEGASDLLVVPPLDITDAILASNIPAYFDHAEWAGGTTYSLGDRVVVEATHRIYESLVVGNVGNVPASAPDKWLDVGPTTRWAMFDQALGTRSALPSAITVTITPPVPINAVAALDVVGASVRLRVEDATTASPFEETAPNVAKKVWTGLPTPAGQKIIVTIQPQAGVAQIGTLLLGTAQPLGRTAATPNTGFTDYSRKDTDDFGNTTVVERGWAERLAVRSLIRADAGSDVLSRMIAVRATPALWLAATDVDALAVYGFYRDFGLTFSGNTANGAFTIEGLTKAPPTPLPFNLADGQSAYSPLLSNESHTLPANADGTVTSYAGASFAVSVLYGSEDVTSQFEASFPSGSNPQSLTVTGTYPNYAITGGLDPAEDGASLTIVLSGLGVHAGVTLEKVFSLAKSKAGANGEPPPLLTLDASANVVRYNPDGTIVPGQPVTFTATRQNSEAAAIFEIYNGAGEHVAGPATPDGFVAAFPGSYTTAGPDSLTMTASGVADTMAVHGGAAGKFTVRAYIDGSVVADRVTVAKIKNGADGTSGYTFLLSNESHTVPAQNDGTVISYAGADTTLRIFYGTTDVTSLFGITTSPSNPQGLTVTGTYPNFAVVAGFDPGEDVAAFTFRVLGTGAHAGVTLDKVFSLAKSKAALNGASPPLLTITASSQVLHLNADGSLPAGTPNFVFTALRQNFSTAINWQADPSHNLTLGGGSLSSDTLTLTATAARMREVLLHNRDVLGIGLTQKVLAYDATGTLVDVVTVVAVLNGAPGTDGEDGSDGEDGADGVDGFAVSTSQPNFVIPCYSNGTAKPIWSGGSTTIRLQKGGTAITPDGGYSVPSQNGMASLSIAGNVVTFAGLTADTGKFTARATHQGVPYDTIVTVEKAKDGEAAFKGSTNLVPQAVAGAPVQMGNGATTVPGGRACVVSAVIAYHIDPQIVGTFTGRITLYWKNETDAGPLNLLGIANGSQASLVNNSSIPGEPEYVYTDGVANASFAFTAPAGDKQIGYYAFFERISGARAVIASGSMSLEVSS